ncbi:hypothetical protein F0562_023918 [Nyssa sinensis]|uniref:Uncharacterized protein n=1 Tax=Nyssa sinensis TaxID=561372 RepID=A0A5J5BJC6_9ASTE|nr:hypothetical protein F0562_023918 [Nyssa sinensis]
MGGEESLAMTGGDGRYNYARNSNPQGLLSKDKLDSFNLPIYSPSSEELEKLIEKTGCFDIARVEEMHRNTIPLLTMQECIAGLQGIIETHFGSEILDDLFDRYAKKIGIALFVLLKRKH